jgi:hypothetical protein
MRGNSQPFLAPELSKAMHAVVGHAAPAPTQFLEQPLRRTTLPLPQLGFRLRNLRRCLDPNAKLRRGLKVPCVLELGPAASDHLANRRPRHRERPHDLLDRALLLEIGAPYLADLVHAKHPRPFFPTTWVQEKDADRQLQRGPLLDAKAAPQGVVIASDFASRLAPMPLKTRSACSASAAPIRATRSSCPATGTVRISTFAGITPPPERMCRGRRLLRCASLIPTPSAPRPSHRHACSATPPNAATNCLGALRLRHEILRRS